MINVANVFRKNWYGYDYGTYGSGAKYCKGCSANSYTPEHKPDCEVVKAAEELAAVGIVVDVKI